MPSYETTPPNEAVDSGDEKVTERATEALKAAFKASTEADKQGMAILLMNMQFDRATNGELLSDAFGAIKNIGTDERFMGPQGLDNRVERLFAIIDHNEKLVGKNLTVADAQEILKDEGYEGSRLSGQQYKRAA